MGKVSASFFGEGEGGRRGSILNGDKWRMTNEVMQTNVYNHVMDNEYQCNEVMDQNETDSTNVKVM